jgi:5-methylcytosine-specific restriction endonuclease McrA
MILEKNKSKKDGLATECKDCKNSQDKKYRKEHADYYKEYNHKYNAENKDILSKKKTEYIANNKEKHWTRQHNWYIKNIDTIKIRVSEYKKEHPTQYQMYSNRRLARKRTIIIDIFTTQDIINKYGNKCVYCDGLFEEIDHYVPLSKGGSHTLDNVRPSCEHCNLIKSNKLPEEFMKYKGNNQND